MLPGFFPFVRHSQYVSNTLPMQFLTAMMREACGNPLRRAQGSYHCTLDVFSKLAGEMNFIRVIHSRVPKVYPEQAFDRRGFAASDVDAEHVQQRLRSSAEDLGSC